MDDRTVVLLIATGELCVRYRLEAGGWYSRKLWQRAGRGVDIALIQTAVVRWAIELVEGSSVQLVTDSVHPCQLHGVYNVPVIRRPFPGPAASRDG